MPTVTHLATELQTLFQTQAEALGQEMHLIQRRRAFSAPLLAQTLVFGWLQNPAATLAELACLAATLGADVTQQALNQRFTPTCARFLLALFTTLCRRSVQGPSSTPFWSRFSAIFVLDASVVMLPRELQTLWPGCGGTRGANAGLKLHSLLELRSGQLALELSDAKTHDARSELASSSLEPGSLRIADLGYFKLVQLATYHRQGVYWLSRLKVGTVWFDATGQKVDLLALLAQTTDSTLEQTGYLGHQRLPARLFAYRVAPEQQRQRHAQVLNRAKRKGRPPSRSRVALSGWTLLVTNAPTLSAEAAYELYRVRWQIELVFKRWKQQGRLAKWRSQNPWRILCEVYAKLIGFLVQHWLTLDEGWANLRRSPMKVEREGRKFALMLAVSLSDQTQLRAILVTLRRSFGKAVQIDRRRRQPATWQAVQGLT